MFEQGRVYKALTVADFADDAPATPAAEPARLRTMRELRKAAGRLNAPATDTGDSWLDGDETPIRQRVMRGTR